MSLRVYGFLKLGLGSISPLVGVWAQRAEGSPGISVRRGVQGGPLPAHRPTEGRPPLVSRVLAACVGSLPPDRPRDLRKPNPMFSLLK